MTTRISGVYTLHDQDWRYCIYPDEQKITVDFSLRRPNVYSFSDIEREFLRQPSSMCWHTIYKIIRPYLGTPTIIINTN